MMAKLPSCHRGWQTVQAGAGTPLRTCRPEPFTPLQPTSQGRESSYGDLEAAFWSQGHQGEVGWQGPGMRCQLGRAYLTREENTVPVNLFYFLFVQHARSERVFLF